MKRTIALKTLIASLKDGDMGLFIGDAICNEAKEYDRPGNVYLSSKYDNLISLGLGLAMGTNRRIFMFCEDSYLLRNISEAAHLSVSKCKNVFLVLLISGVYSDFGTYPNIFDNFANPSGIFFNMGLLVHNYTKHFKISKNPVKVIRQTWCNIRGPLTILIRVDPVMSTNTQQNIDTSDSIFKLKEFINSSIPAYNYTPPVGFGAVPDSIVEG